MSTRTIEDRRGRQWAVEAMPTTVAINAVPSGYTVRFLTTGEDGRLIEYWNASYYDPAIRSDEELLNVLEHAIAAGNTSKEEVLRTLLEDR